MNSIQNGMNRPVKQFSRFCGVEVMYGPHRRLSFAVSPDETPDGVVYRGTRQPSDTADQFSRLVAADLRGNALYGDLQQDSRGFNQRMAQVLNDSAVPEGDKAALTQGLQWFGDRYPSFSATNGQAIKVAYEHLPTEADE